jgi:serine/threonine protein kinase
MPISPGSRFGPYEIVAAIGAGGMGDVYRARDPRLGRDVALKLLPDTLAADPDRRSRLLREARAAGGLNHSNICTIYDVGDAGGHAYIAMEVVEGDPLSRRLASRPLPIDEVVRYGLQLADALAHAHDHGIVHRDLKSANIVVTAEGRVKVLDFGLAKRTALDAVADIATQTVDEAGVLSGTLPYMAPEQLRGVSARLPSSH